MIDGGMAELTDRFELPRCWLVCCPISGRNRSEQGTWAVFSVRPFLSHATINKMKIWKPGKTWLMAAGWTSCFHDGKPLAFFC